MNGCLEHELARITLAELPASHEARMFIEHARHCARCSAVLEEVRQATLLCDIRSFEEHPSGLDLSFYLDTAPEDSARTAIDRHLEACQTCRNRIDMMTIERRQAASRSAQHYHYRRRWLTLVPDLGMGIRLLSQRPRAGLALASAMSVGLLLSIGVWRHRVVEHGLRPHLVVTAMPYSVAPVSATGTASKPAIDDGIVALTASGRISTTSGIAYLGNMLQNAVDAPALHLPSSTAPLVGPVRGEGTDFDRPQGLGAIRLKGKLTRIGLRPLATFDWFLPNEAKGTSYTLDVQEADGSEPLRALHHLRRGPITLKLTPGRTYLWRVEAVDPDEIPVASSPYGRVLIVSAVAGKAIQDHPSAHLLRGILYEREGAFEEALAEYRQLRPRPGGYRAKERLIVRVRTEISREARSR
jgi:hypothetical protein